MAFYPPPGTGEGGCGLGQYRIESYFSGALLPEQRADPTQNNNNWGALQLLRKVWGAFSHKTFPKNWIKMHFPLTSLGKAFRDIPSN